VQEGDEWICFSFLVVELGLGGQDRRGRRGLMDLLQAICEMFLTSVIITSLSLNA
jgi:hypothetical protein